VASATEFSVSGSGLTPALYRVVARGRETADVVTLWLESRDGERLSFRSGQFNMLSALGVGEVAVSVSGSPSDPGPLRHTVRDVGAVTHALCSSDVGDVIGVRGPFGTDWGVTGNATPHDTVVVAGGIGLAPLRGAVEELVAAQREGAGRVFVLVGAREPGQMVFLDDLAAWEKAGVVVLITVDRPAPGWSGRVGLVTTLLANAGFDALHCRVLICGPEIMMRFTARALNELGVDLASIWVSLERNMQCGLGWCGHCQLGPLLLCRDGPVVNYLEASALMNERER
jgi:anaerobic sulfite reductase subunit B